MFLQTSYGQNKVLSYTSNYFSEKLDTKIDARYIDISFFDEVILDDVTIYDSDKDTLLYVQKLNFDIGIFSYFNEKLIVDKIKIKGANIKVSEVSKGKFNFDHFIEGINSMGGGEKDTLSEPWDINLKAIEIENTNFHFHDSNNLIITSFDLFKGDLKKFSFEELLFHFDFLNIEGLRLDYYKPSSSTIDKSTIDNSTSQFPSLPIDLLADNLSINGQDINYNTTNTKSSTTSFDPNQISIEQINIKSKNFVWTDSIQVSALKINTKMPDGFVMSNQVANLKLTDQSLEIGGAKIQTLSSTVAASGIVKYKNFNSLINDFQNTNSSFEIKNTTISKNDISYFVDNSSFEAINLDYLDEIKIEGNLLCTNGRLDVKGLKIQGDNKFIFEGALTLSDISNFESSKVIFDIDKFKTSQKTFENIFPGIKLPNELNNLGNLTGTAKGQFISNNLNFDAVKINTSQGTKLSGRGRIYDFKNDNGPEIDFQIDELETNLNYLLSEKANLPVEIQRLEDIYYSGILKGNFNTIIANGNLSTSLGDLQLDAKAEFDNNYSTAKYGGYFNLQNFDLGTMLNDTTFGITNFAGNIKGSGLTLDQLNTTINGKVKSIYYDGYTYRDITIDGKYSDDLFDGKLVSKDKNLNLNFDGKMDLSGSSSELDFTMDLNSIDLKELGFLDSLMILGGEFKGKIKGNTIDEIIGQGVINNFSIQTNKGTYNADSSITVKIEEINNGAKVYSLDSPFLDGELKGNIEPSSFVRVIKNYIKKYIPVEVGYDLDNEDDLNTYIEENTDQNFIISAKTKDMNPFLVPFLGDDFTLNEASIGAYFSSKETRLDVKGVIDSLIYKGILFQRGSYFFDGQEDLIYGNIHFEDISKDNEILVPKTDVNVVLNNNVADFNLIVSDEADVERLNAEGYLTRTDEYFITFEDSISLNGYQWAFSPYNQVIFGDYGLYMQDVNISKGNQAITLYTDENENGEAIEVLFDNFILSELTAIIDKENEYFEGKINGSMMINSLYSKPFITADLNINDITIKETEAGNLSIIAEQNNIKNSVNTAFLLQNENNYASLDIEYGISTKSTVGTLDIEKLEMAIIDPYLTEIFIGSEGYVNGKIAIDGDLNNLDLKGKLRTHDVKTTPVFTNSRYEILDTDISFTDREIDFGTVELKDSDDNSAFVSGKIYHRNLRHSVVDLNVNTENFEFLNTTSNENELFFGNVKIKGNISVYGPIDDIDIEGSVSAINNSVLSVSPLSLESELLNDDFIIYSGDPRKIPFDSLTIEVQNKKIALPFNVNMKINVDKDSEFSLILNPITGDKLTCNGQSDLILKLNKEGKMELFGIYTVTEGAYTFSYGPIAKEFNIKSGSTVVLNGDPLKGTLNVDAVYVANTAVFDLLQLEADKFSDAEKSEAQRKRDINVVLNLSKSIEKPEITLDITTNEDELSSISDILNRKLSQLREDPDELNRQVFGLLLFDNFLLLQNADTDLAKTGTDLAIGSISGLVTSQLNKLTDGLIEGFEVNFDVNSYSSDFLAEGGQGVVTELGLGVKKSLFDDRFTITAETNINLESTSETSEFNTIAGNFILEYKLTEKGSYRVRAFRKSSFNRLGEDENSSINGGSFFLKKEFGEIRKKKN